MIVDARVEAWAALQAIALPPRALVGLLRHYGSPAAILAATPADRRRFAPTAVAAALDAGPPPERLAASLAWLAQPDSDLVAWDDPDYPAALLEIADPPPVLYCRGRRELLGRPAFAIVGSRNATPQGIADAEAFAFALSAAGLVVVSGLAAGIDAAAHRGALQAPGSTIAVTGTGPDRVYPAAHRDLAHAIAGHGLLLSEFTPGTAPLKQNFPRRNRIVSGLARGILVVEATLSSGSLITARLAAEQGREVFALPGSIHSPFSKGCHRLLREGAKLVETANDILDELRLPAVAPPAPAGPAPARTTPELEPEARALLDALGHDPADTDALAARTGQSAAATAARLSRLELDGIVFALPGGRWQRRP
jgi:DNA processing protein